MIAGPSGGGITGWRQGHVLPDSVARSIPEFGNSLGPDDLVVVVSTDCDVAAIDFEKEPFFEGLIARLTQTSNGNLRHGKNPRRIQVGLLIDGLPTLFEASIDERHRVERELLADADPDWNRRLPPNDLRCLRLWLAKRYYRTAFPGSFNERIAPVVDRIRRRARQGGEYISGFWVALNTFDELPNAEAYEVAFFGLMLVEHYSDAQSHDAAQGCFDDILAVVEQCGGIVIVDEALRSEADVSVDDLRSLHRWDWDDLTLRAEGSEPPVTEADF